MNKWEHVYREEPYDFSPNARLAQWVPRIPVPPGGPALDVACGGGRNTLLLAELGWTVDAWEDSPSGLSLLTAEAARRGLQASIRPRRVDLEAPALTLPGAAWDLVICLYFLHRPLLPMVRAALRPGGWVFIESVLDAGPGRQRSRNPDHKLQPGELQEVFAGWNTLLSHENPQRGFATLFGQRPHPDRSGTR